MIKTKLCKHSKSPTEALRKKCVQLAKRIARALANYTCEYCGKKEPQVRTHGSHIYSEGVHLSMSADVDNILCLCATHHMAAGMWNRADHWSWHNSPAEAMEWFKENYPERYETLKLRARENKMCDLKFWQDKWVELNNKYKGISGNWTIQIFKGLSKNN